MAGQEAQPCFCCGGIGKPGLNIAGTFLCFDCERLMLELQPGCQGYDRLVESCKAAWRAMLDREPLL